MAQRRIECVLFDFGGVIAEEGFRRALEAAARRRGLDPGRLLGQAMDAVYDSGFVLGRGSETDFWQSLGRHVDLGEDLDHFREQVLAGFRLRPAMLELADALRERGLTVAILSDQTHWLDHLEARDGFARHFDRVFNSYHLGKGKRDATLFDDTIAALGCRAGKTLFVDDSEAHVQRARGRGLQALHFRETGQCVREVRRLAGLD